MNPTVLKAVFNMLGMDPEEIQGAMKNFAALAQEIDERSKRMEQMFVSIDMRLAALEENFVPRYPPTESATVYDESGNPVALKLIAKA